jgi:hypothetical protein
MTLFDKSLKLALFAGVALLTACPPTDDNKIDSGITAADTDTDSDADSDTDSDTDADTGLVQLYFVGDFATAAGEFSSADFGLGMYGIGMDDWACTITGDLTYEGAAPAGCPDCEWSFDLSGQTNSTATGDYCDQFGFTDGSMDTYNDYSWGFASTYYYDYNGSPLPLEDSLFLYYDGSWFSFAFNYNGRNWVDGDATSLSVTRPAFNSGAYVYYYYYPY